MDAFVSSGFIGVGNVHPPVRCCGGKYDECSAFAKETLLVCGHRPKIYASEHE
jgi:hypothetical protein